ncbi:protein of unknown function [Andreprevotia lacus DSM 23236]|jgi:hypothetical protein|uniref:DUF4124 domain-containing protein n=1 Tax=Andreprevotia lacus DSM 23236 TaxID=1121001 RepID=A0A1W1X1Z8_9NEIS|nr:DUF4124 domain-containing protein [Andreprevotia lacus]SMC17917.1 protein of unknown function [Andreprevotia lacus DSM 23236]
MNARIILIPLLLAAPLALADIYKYVDEEGRVTFSNIPIKGAQRIYVDPAPAVPAPRARTTTGKAANSERVYAPSPGNFPKVDAATQKSRDTNRKLILQEELNAEQQALTDARRSLNDADANRTPEERTNVAKYTERLGRLREAVVLHEKNVAALTNELARAR